MRGLVDGDDGPLLPGSSGPAPLLNDGARRGVAVLDVERRGRVRGGAELVVAVAGRGERPMLVRAAVAGILDQLGAVADPAAVDVQELSAVHVHEGVLAGRHLA